MQTDEKRLGRDGIKPLVCEVIRSHANLIDFFETLDSEYMSFAFDTMVDPVGSTYMNYSYMLESLKEIDHFLLHIIKFQLVQPT